MYLISESLNKLNRLGKLNDPEQKAALTEFRSKLRPMTQFIPVWGEQIGAPGRNPSKYRARMVLALPACVLLGAATFSGALYVVFNVLYTS